MDVLTEAARIALYTLIVLGVVLLALGMLYALGVTLVFVGEICQRLARAPFTLTAALVRTLSDSAGWVWFWIGEWTPRRNRGR